MAESFKNILVIQTAFIGDAILTLPLIQVVKQKFPQSSLDVVIIPKAAEIFTQHPAISEIITYDKHGNDKGIKGFLRLLGKLKQKNYDLIIVPHRSIRSALLAWFLNPNVSIGFDRSAGRRLFSNVVKYNHAAHEIERNLSLLSPLKLTSLQNELPVLYPTIQDVGTVDSIFNELNLNKESVIVAMAPGTVWNTKRWPAERFADVCKQISNECRAIFIIGGKEDTVLCEEITATAQAKNVKNVAGKLSLLQSAELIRRCKVLISNDSAPVHLAVAVGTPVVAIFGATVPEFGFAPRGPRDIILETKGLKCRPCSIHGGNKCPIKTFECMLAIDSEYVLSKASIIFKNKS